LACRLADHPWVKSTGMVHARADGSIASENPPKKYQDIYAAELRHDPEGIYAEYCASSAVDDHGVRISG